MEKAFNGFTLVSSNSSLNCSGLDNYYQTQLIRGAYNYTSLHGTSSTSPSNSTNTTSPATHSKSSKLSTGAKAGIGVGVAVAVIALLAFGVYLFLKKFKVEKRVEGGEGEAVGMGASADDKKPELPQGRYHEKTELEVKEDPGELRGNSVPWVKGSGGRE